MIQKPNLRLRKIGNRYMIVEACDNNVDFTNVYSMNETAAWLWEAVSRGGNCSPAELARNMCQMYRVEYGCALRDVERQLEEWREMGLVDD